MNRNWCRNTRELALSGKPLERVDVAKLLLVSCRKEVVVYDVIVEVLVKTVKSSNNALSTVTES